jgi:hypothetical protein
MSASFAAVKHLKLAKTMVLHPTRLGALHSNNHRTEKR